MVSHHQPTVLFKETNEDDDPVVAGWNADDNDG